MWRKFTLYGRLVWMWKITWAPGLLSASLLCWCYYGSTGDTGACVCIVSVSWCVLYGCPLHCTILSSILFSWEFTFDCHTSLKKICLFISGLWFFRCLKAVVFFFPSLCFLVSEESVEAWCGMDKQQQNSTVSWLQGCGFEHLTLCFYNGWMWMECKWPLFSFMKGNACEPVVISRV